MKRLLLLFFLFPLFTSSQTYPFSEGFEGLASTQVPPGWGGTMKVLLNHGRNNSKGLAARVSSAVPVDSAITPLIGPLTSSSFISFYYRVIDFSFYPDGAATNFDVGDQIEVMLSTDNIIYNTALLIDMNNHNTSFNFVKKKIFVTQHPGNTAYFKFRCQFGSGASYFVDFDTIVVANDPQIGIDDIGETENIFIYPNPCSSFIHVQVPINSIEGIEVKIFNTIGDKVAENSLTDNFQLPVGNLPNGIYYAHVADKTRKIIRKFIVQH